MPDVLCSICYESLVQKEDDVLAAECGHLFHQICQTKWDWRSRTCPECRKELDKSSMRKVFLVCMDHDCPITPIADSVLMKTNTSLLGQLCEKDADIELLMDECKLLEMEVYSIQKECDVKKEHIRTIEKTIAERNKKIHSKEQIIRTLQVEMKNLKIENNALKKQRDELSAQSKQQDVLEAKINSLTVENQQLRRLSTTKPNHNAKSCGSKKNTNSK